MLNYSFKDSNVWRTESLPIATVGSITNHCCHRHVSAVNQIAVNQSILMSLSCQRLGVNLSEAEAAGVQGHKVNLFKNGLLSSWTSLCCLRTVKQDIYIQGFLFMFKEVVKPKLFHFTLRSLCATVHVTAQYTAWLWESCRQTGATSVTQGAAKRFFFTCQQWVSLEGLVSWYFKTILERLVAGHFTGTLLLL